MKKFLQRYSYLIAHSIIINLFTKDLTIISFYGSNRVLLITLLNLLLESNVLYIH